MSDLLYSQLIKMPEPNPDLPSIIKPKKSKKGTHNRQNGDKEILTGWSNENSLNTSHIAQETPRRNNPGPVVNKIAEVTVKNPPEKAKEANSEYTTLQELKRKLWIDVTREKPYEESLRSYPKSISENMQKYNKMSPGTRTQSSATLQCNIINVYTSEPKSSKTPQGAMTLKSANGREMGISQGNGNVEMPSLVNKPKTPDASSSVENQLAMKEFRLFKALQRNQNPEKRAVTALKKRNNEPINLPTTVIGSASKPLRLEVPRKSKNLKLSKAISYWSQMTSPMGNNVNTGITEENEAERNLDILDIASTEPSVSQPKTPGVPIPKKTLSLATNSVEVVGMSEIKHLVPLPCFRTTTRVKRPVEVEKSEAEARNYASCFGFVKMRTPSPMNIYSKDWETTNGFPRKISRDMGRKSEVRRRPFEEAYGENYRMTEGDMDGSSKNSTENSMEKRDNLFKKIMDRVSRCSIEGSGQWKPNETFLEKQDGNLMNMGKTTGNSFMKLEVRIGVDGKSLKRCERGVRKTMASTDSLRIMKEASESRIEGIKKKEVKNFKLFDGKA